MGSCVGKVVPAAEPTKLGPFETTTDKNVGPLVGAVPDPIHGDSQSRFNVYRPTLGGCFATCKMASDPRITAISTVSGSSANAGIHQPTLLFCGGKDPTVKCSSVESTYASITNQPAMLIDNVNADHVNWSSQGASGPTIAGLVARFRAQ